MKKKELKTKAIKPVKAAKTRESIVKKTRKTAPVKAAKVKKKVSKIKAVSKPGKIVQKAVSAKGKTSANKKPFLKGKDLSATAKNVTERKKPLEKTGLKAKVLKTKPVAKKPVSKKVAKKLVKTALKKIVKAPVEKRETKKALPEAETKPSAKTKPAPEKAKKAVVKKIAVVPSAKPAAIPRKITSVKKVSVQLKPKEKEKILIKAPLKIFLPEKGQAEEIIQELTYKGLSEEYGENDFFIMPIDPKYVFVSWEITKPSFFHRKGALNIRAYDVTGIKFDGSNFNRFSDININTRTGSGFFEINMQGCDVVMELGFLSPGNRFKAIIRSNRILIPSLMTFDELGIARKLYEAGVPVGY